MNDRERMVWVQQTKLYSFYRRSRKELAHFVRANRDLIDDVVSDVVGDVRLARCLAYPNNGSCQCARCR